MPLTLGARIGPYEVTALLGQGGMGEVYRARDTALQRDVAIKILPTTVETRRWSSARVTDLGTTVRAFDIHPDGQRVLIGSRDPTQSSEAQLVYVSNFFEELRQRLSSGSH